MVGAVEESDAALKLSDVFPDGPLMLAYANRPSSNYDLVTS